MKRRIAAFLTCALIAFGQQSRTTPRVVDLVVLDRDDHPVADLSAADFEVLQGGEPRKVTQLTWFDTRRHTARTSGDAASLDLIPDEIHRNFIAVVDDLGLSAAGIGAVQDSLLKFVNEQMGSGERMSVLRTSSGSGDLRQLT